MFRVIVFICALLMFGVSAHSRTPGGEDRKLAIVGADVLPMAGPDKLPDQTVLIDGGAIVAIGPRASVTVPADYKTVDASGLTLLPGLVDMHVHLAPEPGKPGDAAQRALAVMLGHGVTTARTMAGSPQNLTVRGAVERGELAGPRLYVAAPGLNDNNTPSAEAARTAVAAAKAAGYDLIKAHHLTDPDVWTAVQQEAGVQGLPTAGHVANQIGLAPALAAGQQIEHLDGFLFELLPERAPERAIEFAQIPPPPVIRALAGADQVAIDKLARQAAASKMYQVPTLALFEKVVELGTPVETLLARPEMRYIPDAALDQWTARRAGLEQAGFTAEDGRMFRDVRRRIVRALHQAGVPIMAGSDTAQSFHVWGPGLIEEIEALSAAGLSNMDALRSATIVPRDYFRSLPNGGSDLGGKANFGTVEKGARADLILVAGDPSVSLANLRKLRAVVKGGEWYDRAALDAMLKQAADDAKRVAPAAAPAREVYVMRHLERGQGDDPGLTARGAAQAARLAETLGAAGITQIFVTDTRRARETAQPLAARLKIEPTLYDPRQPDALVRAAAAVPGNTLVVGHSNTVADLVGRFGGVAPAPLGESDYGTIWRVAGPSGVTREFSVDGPRPAALGPCSGRNLHPSARCGTIAVREDRAKTDGRMIDIHFAVVPASGAAVQAPIAMLPGGPGLGGIQAGPGIEAMFGPMHRDRDILLIDQRGTGLSNPLPCARETRDPLGQLAGWSPAQVQRCRDALTAKADLAHYHTREAVLDMEEVRRVLGYPRLDLFGMSYGTRVALDYLRLFPERVGETVIRAAAPPSMMLPLWTPQDSQIAFDRMVAICRAQATCAARHPDLQGDLEKMLERLARGPVPVGIVVPGAGQRIETSLDRNALGAALFAMLYIPENYVQLPPLLEQAGKGDFSPLLQAAAPFLFGVGDQVAWGMRWSVICDEDVRRIDPSRVAKAAGGTFMGPEAVREEMMACEHWPRAAVPADYLEPVTSDLPVLIISGELDPVAGARWGEDIARTLRTSVHVEAKGASHYPPLPGCTLELMQRFLDGAPLASLDVGCVEETRAPRLRVAS